MLGRVSASARAAWQWLIVDPLPAWFAIGVPLLGLWGAAFVPGPAELAVRMAGYVVTLAGVGLVVKGIREKRRHFGRPSLLKRVQDWLGRLPAIVRGPRVVEMSATSTGSATLSARLQVRKVAAPSASLDERLAALEENFRLLDEQISKAENEIRADLASLRTSLDAERSARAESVKDLTRQLENLSAGGLDFEAVGVAWVVIGNAFTTFPYEIAQLAGL